MGLGKTLQSICIIAGDHHTKATMFKVINLIRRMFYKKNVGNNFEPDLKFYGECEHTTILFAIFLSV